jgi:hypothetical protein
MNTRRLFGLALLICATGFASCAQVEEDENGLTESLAEIGVTASPKLKGRSGELSRIQFDDIPVPDGFFLRNHRNETFSFSAGDQRVGRFVYWGIGEEAELLRYFETQMVRAPYGWSRASRPASDGGRRLHFEKPGHRCDVEIERVDTPPGRSEFLINIFVEST